MAKVQREIKEGTEVQRHKGKIVKKLHVLPAVLAPVAAGMIFMVKKKDQEKVN